MQCKCGSETQDRISKNSSAGLALKYAICPNCTRCGVFRLLNDSGEEIASGDKAQMIFDRAGKKPPVAPPASRQQSILET